MSSIVLYHLITYSIFIDISDAVDESVRQGKELKYATDLVKHIKNEFGNYFGIGVAG